MPALTFAQTAPPPASQAPSTAIRIDVNLVQVDAVVTDSGTGASPICRPRTSKSCRTASRSHHEFLLRFTSRPRPQPARRAAAKLAKGEVPPPPPVLRPTEVRRTLALVVDDLGLAAENIPRVRNAIRKFIDEQMRPGDLVAIVRTGAGMGALQQFTTDKRLLYEALDRVKYGESRVGVSSFAPLGRAAWARRTRGHRIDHLREDSLAVGTLGAIRFVVNAMGAFPGRKSVVLFTENIRLIFRGTTDEMVAHAVQQLSDAASRASVVIHAIDPRGLPDFNVNAHDNTAGMSRRRVSRVPAQRETEMDSYRGRHVRAGGSHRRPVSARHSTTSAAPCEKPRTTATVTT